MRNVAIYLLTVATKKTGYIVVDGDNDIEMMARYMAEYGMPSGELLRSEDYPSIYNIFWYVQRVYNGYKWQIITK